MMAARGNGYVRMRTIFGESVLPPDSARVVIRAVNLMTACRDVPPRARWMAVELWAADYIAGYRAQQAALELAAAEEGLTIGEPVVHRAGQLWTPLGGGPNSS